MAEFALKYDRSIFTANLEAHLISGASKGNLPDPVIAVRQALSHPIGSAHLRDIVKPTDRVVIVTSDITRYTASEIYLPILVEELNSYGVSKKQIEIIVGLGIHRKQSPREHRKILGSLFGEISVCDHDCDDISGLTDLGTTSLGFPVQINRKVVEADRIIVTGTIGLHYFAGFGGGRKGLVPGVASRETCMATHFAVFNPPEIGGRHPNATTANLHGNPVHEAILEAAQMVRPDFLLNTVLTADKKIKAVFCGDMAMAHLAGCAVARELYTKPLAKAFDLAIVSCGGHPKDINFIQAHKALDYSVHAVKPGGVVILLASCPDGFGNETFYDWFQYDNLDAFENALRSHYEINGQTAWSTLVKAKTWHVILVSEFSFEQTQKMGMTKARTLDEALQMAHTILPRCPETVVIPDGGSILPVVAS